MKPALLIACLFAAASAYGDRGFVLHKERSMYQTIIILKNRAEICMQFSVRRNQKNQTCRNERAPRKMVFSYTRMMMASLLLNDAPKRVLMVGLGGGTLPTALHELYPDAVIDAVEVDPAVVRMAREYFDFKSNAQLRVHEIDARVFTKRALKRGEAYDLILLDAFGGDYIPEHLMTREYLEENRELLTEDGVLAANTFAVSDLYDHESVTYADVFGRFYNFKMWSSSNRVIIASKGELPEPESLVGAAEALAERLRVYGVPIRRYPNLLDVGVDWDEDARVLTDQYSPANLLKNR